MKRKLVFSNEAWQDADCSILRRANQLIKDIRRSPHEGIGKPEPLKHQLAG